MFHFKEYINKFFLKNIKKYNKFVEYNPEKIEEIIKKYNELNDYTTDLEKLLKTAEQKTHTYEDILLKYEKILNEEISLYNLQQSNISLLNKDFNENEIFINEIQLQIQTFFKKSKQKNKPAPTFNRLISRFFHQNELYKARTQKKLCELNETIDKKNRMIERMHHEITSWDNEADASYSSSQQLSLKQACG